MNTRFKPTYIIIILSFYFPQAKTLDLSQLVGLISFCHSSFLTFYGRNEIPKQEIIEQYKLICIFCAASGCCIGCTCHAYYGCSAFNATVPAHACMWGSHKCLEIVGVDNTSTIAGLADASIIGTCKGLEVAGGAITGNCCGKSLTNMALFNGRINSRYNRRSNRPITQQPQLPQNAQLQPITQQPPQPQETQEPLRKKFL